MELLKEKLKSQESHTILCGDPNSTDHLVFNIEWIDAGPSNDPHGYRKFFYFCINNSLKKLILLLGYGARLMECVCRICKATSWWRDLLTFTLKVESFDYQQYSFIQTKSLVQSGTQSVIKVF